MARVSGLCCKWRDRLCRRHQLGSSGPESSQVVHEGGSAANNNTLSSGLGSRKGKAGVAEDHTDMSSDVDSLGPGAGESTDGGNVAARRLGDHLKMEQLFQQSLYQRWTHFTPHQIVEDSLRSGTASMFLVSFHVSFWWGAMSANFL